MSEPPWADDDHLFLLFAFNHLVLHVLHTVNRFYHWSRVYFRCLPVFILFYPLFLMWPSSAHLPPHPAPQRPPPAWTNFFLLVLTSCFVRSGASSVPQPHRVVLGLRQLQLVLGGLCSFAADALAPPPGRLQPHRDRLDPASGTQSSQPGRLHMRSRCRSGSGAAGPDGFHVDWSSRGTLGKAAPVLMLITGC